MNAGVGFALILLVSIGGNYILFSRLQETKESLDTLSTKLDKIDKAQTINNEEIVSLSKKQSTIEIQARAANAQLQKLATEKPEVKAYLDAPIPADVGRVLNEARVSD